MATPPRGLGAPGYMASVAGSPSKFLTMEDLIAAAKSANDMVLAHEIAVDNNFKLQKYELPENSVEKQVTDIVHRAFWDTLRAALAQDPPNYEPCLTLIEEIRGMLSHIILPTQAAVRREISDVLDMEIIRQKLDMEVFELQPYSEFLIPLLGKLCAPVRDAAVQELKSISDPVDLFKRIIEVIELMRMDLANFTVQQIRPIVQQNAVEYERKKFQEFLDVQQQHGVDGLEFTRAWLGEVARLSAQELGEVSIPDVLSRAYVGLLSWKTADNFPETLLLDQVRFLDLATSYQQLIFIASSLLIMYNTVGAPIVGVTDFKTKMKDEVKAILGGADEKNLASVLRGLGDHIVRAVKQELSKREPAQHLPQEKELLISRQISDLSEAENSVSALLRRRAESFFTAVMEQGAKGRVQIPAGLSAVEPELAALTGQFLRLISHNRQVFAEHYAEIIRTAASAIAAPVPAPVTAAEDGGGEETGAVAATVQQNADGAHNHTTNE